MNKEVARLIVAVDDEFHLQEKRGQAKKEES